MSKTKDLAKGVLAGDRASLARAITLVESTRAADAKRAAKLLAAVLPQTGRALRVGISGVPGAGKSTFIEALGERLTAVKHKVAVLAVDPTSSLSGGSILGDKTRMPQLARHPQAFIRPSPGGRTLGGVARRTREALLLCEAAGYDVVLVETIGVGQSEVAVAGMVDVFLLLVVAGAGDELQGMKRGVTEMADVVVVTKADGDNVARAEAARAEYAAALRLLRHPGGIDPEGDRPVLTCSAKTEDGLVEVWATVESLHAAARESGRLEERRREQALRWFDDTVDDLLRRRFDEHPDVADALPGLREDVLAGKVAPTAAAQRLLARFVDRSGT